MIPRLTESIYRYRWVVLVLALIAQWSNAMTAQVIAPLAPLFQPELGLSKAEVGVFASAVFAGTWCILLVGGSLSDRLGVRTMMALGQVVAGAFLLLMAVAGSFLQAAAVMFAAGLGRGTIVPSSTKAIMDWFPPTARGTAMGIKQTGVPVAGIVTAAVLPALALTIGWRLCVALMGLWIIAGGVLSWALYRDARQSDQASERQVGMRAGVWVLLRNPSIWILSFVALSYVTVQLSLVAHMTLYLKEIVLVPAIPEESTRIIAAGGYLAICHSGGVLGRVFWGAVSDRAFQGRRMLMMGLVGAFSVVASVAVGSLEAGCPLWLLTGVMFAYGLTAIGWNGLYHALMVETAGKKLAGTGVGLVMSLSQAGAVAGPPLFGLIVDTSGSYRAAWFFLGAVCAAGSLVALLAARGEKPPAA